MATFDDIFPFIVKDGTLNVFKTISTDQFSGFEYGDTITGSYQRTSSISSDRYITGSSRRFVDALKNTFNYYKPYSPHYAFSSSLGDKSTQDIRLLSFPVVFYGSNIEKGSVSLCLYITGVLAAELVDDKYNGELRQKFPQDSNSSSVAGVVLYNEGFIALTGTWDIHPTHTENYDAFNTAASIAPRWVDFATTGSDTPGDGSNVPSSSFKISYRGTQYVPVVTMLAHAKPSELNFSSNPTFIDYEKRTLRVPVTGTKSYKERSDITMKNTVASPFVEPTGTIAKQVFISKIGIYDENKNLIAVGKLAKPVRKREFDNYTIRLSIDF